MRSGIILTMLAVMVLVFGCTGQSNTTNPDSTTGATEQGEMEASNVSDEVGGETDSASENEIPDESETQHTEPDDVNLEGMQYSEILALGVPVQCHILSTHEGQSIESVVYLNGGKETRAEFMIDSMEEDVGCNPLVSIIKGDSYYIGCDEGNYPPMTDCNWIMMSVESSHDSDPADMQVSFNAPEFEDVPSTDIDCVPWVYDESMFQTHGEVCAMEDFSQLTEGYEPA